MLGADLGDLFVADDVVVAVAEGREHQPLDPGGVHVLEDFLGGHATLEDRQGAVALEDADELGGPAVDGAGLHQRRPGIDGAHGFTHGGSPLGWRGEPRSV
jgi:hypothetical protein